MLTTSPCYTGQLEALHSKRDRFGNCYWAFRFTDFTSGKVVEATISGGESNIYCILSHWPGVDGRNRAILWRVSEWPIREFNRMTRDWRYAGCTPSELSAFIQAQLTREGE